MCEEADVLVSFPAQVWRPGIYLQHLSETMLSSEHVHVKLNNNLLSLQQTLLTWTTLFKLTNMKWIMSQLKHFWLSDLKQRQRVVNQTKIYWARTRSLKIFSFCVCLSSASVKFNIRPLLSSACYNLPASSTQNTQQHTQLTQDQQEHGASSWSSTLHHHVITVLHQTWFKLERHIFIMIFNWIFSISSKNSCSCEWSNKGDADRIMWCLCSWETRRRKQIHQPV